jgi:uroporphyrinogen-III synthase
MVSSAEWCSSLPRPRSAESQDLSRASDVSAVDLLRRIATRFAETAPLDSVLADVVEFVAAVATCNSCFIYVLDDEGLVLRASKNPHPEIVRRLKIRIGQGITGWVAEHRELAVIPRRAWSDPRFKVFNELPEDRFEAFLSVPLVGRGHLVGVINVQNRDPYDFSEREIGLVSTIGYLVGAEIEMARLEEQNAELSKRLESRTLVERAKGILQVDLGISEREAYQKLQRQSQQMRRSMKEIAEAVVLSHALKSGEPA